MRNKKAQGERKRGEGNTPPSPVGLFISRSATPPLGRALLKPPELGQAWSFELRRHLGRLGAGVVGLAAGNRTLRFLSLGGKLAGGRIVAEASLVAAFDPSDKKTPIFTRLLRNKNIGQYGKGDQDDGVVGGV